MVTIYYRYWETPIYSYEMSINVDGIIIPEDYMDIAIFADKTTIERIYEIFEEGTISNDGTSILLAHLPDDFIGYEEE